jgi:hypothetical protein
MIKGIRCLRGIRGVAPAAAVAWEASAQVMALSRADRERFAGPSPVGVPEAASAQVTGVPERRVEDRE